MLDLSLYHQFDNTKTGRCTPHDWLLKHRATHAIIRPNRRYRRNVRQCLADADLETVLVNPLCSLRFVEAIGHLAKNDRIDAAMLARVSPPKTRKPSRLSKATCACSATCSPFAAASCNSAPCVAIEPWLLHTPLPKALRAHAGLARLSEGQRPYRRCTPPLGPQRRLGRAFICNRSAPTT